MEKVERDGKVAVLYSPGFGAGWYSWNTEYPEMLFHPELVRLVEEEDFGTLTDDDKVREILGYKRGYMYCGGGRDLTIEWLPKGTLFKIDEYDGNESVDFYGSSEYFTA